MNFCIYSMWNKPHIGYRCQKGWWISEPEEDARNWWHSGELDTALDWLDSGSLDIALYWWGCGHTEAQRATGQQVIDGAYDGFPQWRPGFWTCSVFCINLPYSSAPWLKVSLAQGQTIVSISGFTRLKPAYSRTICDHVLFNLKICFFLILIVLFNQSIWMKCKTVVFSSQQLLLF